MIHYLLVDSSKLISLIKNDKSEKVLVLEDCEAYLKARDISHNPQIVSTLLQLTDGILADLLKMPVICTYNSKDLKIDEALLGVGRLQVQYEFKALNKDKVNQLCNHLEMPELNKEMVLSEVLNYHLLPIKEETVTRKIGF
jgi:hypothetical protein